MTTAPDMAAAVPHSVRQTGGLRAQVVYLFGSNLVDRVIALAGSAVMARYLGAAELGLVGPALVVGALVGRLTDLGVSITVQRDVARAPALARDILAPSLGLRLLSTCAGAVLLAAYAFGTEGFTAPAWLPLLAGSAALLTGWSQLFSAVWLGALRSEWVALAQAVYRVLYLALIVVVVFVRGSSTGMMAALAAAASVQLLLGVGITRRAFFHPHIDTRIAPAAAVLRDSWPIGISALTVMAYDRIDTLVASWFLAPAAVGNYFAAYALYSATLTISNALTSVAFSVFSEAARDTRLLVRKYSRTLVLTLGLGVTVTLGFLLVGPLIVRIVYGGKYTTAAGSLRILAVAVPFLFANNLAGVTLNAIGRQKTTMVLTGLALAFNLVLNLMFVPRFGILAAAWSTCATEAVIALGACAAIQHAWRTTGLSARLVRETAGGQGTT